MLRDLSFQYLIGNKLDLDQASSASSLLQDGKRQVDFDEAQEFAQTRGLLFNEVSAHKRKNIELVLKMLRTRASRILSEQKDLHLVLDRNEHAQNYWSNNQDGFFEPEQVMIEEESYSIKESRLISVEEKAKLSQHSSNTLKILD